MQGIKLKKSVSIGTAVFTAVSLKLCCWGPLLLTSIAGISGSSVYFSWLTTIKPYLLIIAFLSLGYAFYQVYKPKKQSNCLCNCNNEKVSFFKSKLYIWIVAAFVILMTLISYYPQLFHNKKEVITTNKMEIQTVILNIKGITCSGCEENINSTVMKLDGILKINTSHKTGTSIIEFDKRKTNINIIKDIIISKGYEIEKKN